MPPRPRAARTPATAADYKFPEAERLNNPTAEGALMMGPDALADQPIPDDAQDTDRVRHPRLQWNRAPQTDYSKTYGPLYIHDKISPTEFLNSLLRHQGQGDMFATFNGLPDDANYKPYEYSGHWTNRLIRATAQRAMASLLYKDAMRGKVNLIYMDPPYNISFRSNFQANAQNCQKAQRTGTVCPTILWQSRRSGTPTGTASIPTWTGCMNNSRWAENCLPKTGASSCK